VAVGVQRGLGRGVPHSSLDGFNIESGRDQQLAK